MLYVRAVDKGFDFGNAVCGRVWLKNRRQNTAQQDKAQVPHDEKEKGLCEWGRQCAA